MEPIRTKRLILRRPTTRDLADFLAYRNEPESMSRQGLTAISERDAKRFLRAQSKQDWVKATGWIMFGIEDPGLGRIIGEVGMYVPPGQREANIGWGIENSRQGNGFATEAAEALVRFAFETRLFHRLTANCDADNAASARIMTKLGMREEGRFVQSVQRADGWRDVLAYAILRDEWMNRSHV